MPNSTINYNLTKPLAIENYDVEDQNGNMDIIDAIIKETDNKVVDLIENGVTANGGDADTVNGHTVESNVPAGAKFTDTVYTHPNDVNTRHVTDAEKTAWNAKAPNASPTFTGTAKSTANVNYTTSQLRNALFGTTVPTTLANGEIYFMYE